jgi:PAS domain S-box-containing protein
MEAEAMDSDSTQRLLDALLEQLPLGVTLASREGEIVYINRSAEDIRNVKRDDLLGRNVLNYYQESQDGQRISRGNAHRAMKTMVENPDTVYRRMVDDKENGKYYVNTYKGVTDNQQNVIGMVMLTEDITEKRRMEMERATSYRMMQETSDNLKQRYHQLLVMSLESIAKLLEKRDPYTSDHSGKVCEYALKMYEHRYGIGVDYETLKIAATLHDIGKVGIPDEILKKAGALTKEEFEIIKLHSVIAEDILKPLDAGSNLSDVVRHHHEHFDGSGYPDGLKGEEIPTLSRIISIADAFDAMRSDRSYRKAMPYERSIQEIINYMGRQFDPEWTEVFLDLAKTGSL